MATKAYHGKKCNRCGEHINEAAYTVIVRNSATSNRCDCYELCKKCAVDFDNWYTYTGKFA